LNAGRKIVLETGEEYYGLPFGCEDTGEDGGRLCEMVFNTSAVGYQEIISDPSYTYQAVVMTYPLIGNYGIAADDFESPRLSVGALIVRDYCGEPSNHGCVAALGDVMKKHGVPGIYGVDTRKLTRVIRDRGSMKVLVTASDFSREKAMRIIRENGIPSDAVKKVGGKGIRNFGPVNGEYRVAAIDCGMKANITRSLTERGCRVTVVGWDAKPEEIENLSPDGVFISNGPGDPRDVPETIETVKKLKGRYPIFGICLGHQIISLAYGAETYKLKFGHRGGNHPVREISTGKIVITSQNHSFAVDPKSTDGTGLSVTHVNLLDGTAEGVECEKDGVFAVQYHPESAPGPRDSFYLFDRFISLMEKRKNAKEN